MKPLLPLVLVSLSLLLCSHRLLAQRSLADGLASNQSIADQYYREGNFLDAVRLYQREANDHPSQNLSLKMARAYVALKDYPSAVIYYRKAGVSKIADAADRNSYADALCAVADYTEALRQYEQLKTLRPDDDVIDQKIWQLKNRAYLYEDSSYYSIQKLPLQTPASEIGAVMRSGKIVFMSNEYPPGAIQQLDAKTHSGFYKLFESDIQLDTVQGVIRYNYLKAVRFCPELKEKFHEGPVSFYQQGTRMVFTGVENKGIPKKGNRTTKLFFASKVADDWKMESAFAFNSKEYSISYPWINETGTRLYFTSDMKSGLGGYDIYYSDLKNGSWSKPVNAGPTINTARNEYSPFLRDDVLYFSSEGHPGLGGMDIFRIHLTEGKEAEAKNLGYPVNSSADDFCFQVDAKGEGLFSSNRDNHYQDDDLYSVSILLETYPTVITGALKYKTSNASEAGSLQMLPNTLVRLKDNNKNQFVSEATTDADGNFKLTIPYASQFKLHVLPQDDAEIIVSLELSRRKSEKVYEIVVIKNAKKPARTLNTKKPKR